MLNDSVTIVDSVDYKREITKDGNNRTLNSSEIKKEQFFK